MNGSLGDPALETRIARAMLVGVHAIALLTEEEERALTIAEALAERFAWPLHTWSVASGVDRGGRERELGVLLARLSSSDDEAIWLLFEAGRELRGSAQRRMLRELAQSKRGPTLLLVESDRAALPDIPEVEIERLALPDLDQLRERVRWIADEITPDRPILAAALSDAAETVAAAGLGLTLERFDRRIAEAILSDSATPASVTQSLSRRRVAEACGPFLEPLPPAPTSELVGYARYLEWLRERAPSFGPVRQADLERPQGLGLIGALGCGQRLAARVGAGVLGLSLVRLNLAGSVDPNGLRSTITALERAAPVALYLDELDHPGLVDGLARWLAAGDRGVFTILIATSPERLPQAWSKGERLDALFFVDLPGPERRAELLAKLLAKPSGAAKRPLGDPLPRLLELARTAHGFSGADLADALARARVRCGAKGLPLSAAQFETALAELPPLAVREQHQLEALRAWTKLHAHEADAQAS